MRLKEGEYLCGQCSGVGLVLAPTNDEPFEPEAIVCPHCDGRGKYDWAERATGRIDKSRPYTKKVEQHFLRQAMSVIQRKKGETWSK